MDELEFIMRYIATWMWHILGMMFFIGAIILMVLGVTNKDYAWAVGLFIACGICEVFSFIRRKELKNAQQ